MSVRRAAAVLAVLGMVAGFGYWMGHREVQPPLPRFGADCLAAAGGEVSLDRDQMANAATITAVGVRLEMPEHAVVVALATAMQESKLRNLPHLGRHNDHDSVGLFQQRPSQGWGSQEQVSDPRYAAERFYRALAQVPGWEEMRVTDAAQRVQRSAFPEAYQQWADEAEVLAGALLGRVEAAVTCRAGDTDADDGGPELAEELAAALVRDWGDEVRLAPAEPAGLTVSAPDASGGWRYAHWLVAHSALYGVTLVRFADLEWTAAAGAWAAGGSAIDYVRAETVTD